MRSLVEFCLLLFLKLYSCLCLYTHKDIHFLGPNIAVNKVTTQGPRTFCEQVCKEPRTTCNDNQKKRFCYNASLAVDGDANVDFLERHCSHTDDHTYSEAWWSVDFGRESYITGIRVFNRNELGERLRDFTVWGIPKTEEMRLFQYNYNNWTTSYSTEISIPLDKVTAVNGIRIQIPIRRLPESTILTLCEVQVFSAYCETIHPSPGVKANIFLNTGELINGKHTAGTIVEFSCKEQGQYLVGAKYITCSLQGRGSSWDGDPPTCGRVFCAFSSTFPHGKYEILGECITDSQQRLYYNCEIEPKCDIGFDRIKGGIRKCQISGEWSQANPECRIRRCQLSRNVQNGMYTFQNGSKISSNEIDYGTSIAVKCDRGYQLNGDRTRTCQINKTLTGIDPTCDMIKCGYPGKASVLNGVYLDESGSAYPSGEKIFSTTVYVSCIKGFELASGSSNRTCTENGSWSGQDARCAVVTCLEFAPSDVFVYKYSLNASKGSIPFNVTAKISCATGFLLNGTDTRHCTENKTWDGSHPTCMAIKKPVQSKQIAALTGSIAGGVIGLLLTISILFILKRRGILSFKLNSIEVRNYTDLDRNRLPRVNNRHYVEMEVQFPNPDTGKKESLKAANSTEVYSHTGTVVSDQAYYSFGRQPKLPDTAILVGDLPDLVLNGKPIREKLRKQFEKLPEGMQHSHNEAVKAENKGKNRYKNLYAYDDSRVVLERDSTVQTDYINACFVHGFTQVRKYIASQGPTNDILDDFWRMVWQTQCSRIVMLTNLMELSKPKCDQYWPDKGSLWYGNVKVTKTATEVFSDFLVRKFEFQKEGMPCRTVTQFHYTAWPDKGVPKYASSLVHFRHKVKQQKRTDAGPIVVHCSAGVGRTGTFIALDFLTDQANIMGYVDVLGCVLTLRTQRVNLVQTLEQYIFLHQALVETLMLPTSALSASAFPQYFQELLKQDVKRREGKINTDFKMLSKFSPVSTEDDYISAKQVQNRKKNRCCNILPAESSMPRLTTDNPGENDYINAVFLPSYKDRKAFIITQMPLESTKEDFWRLTWEHDVRTIVMMNQEDEIQESEIYWAADGAEKQFGPLCVTNQGRKRMKQHITVSLTVSRQDKPERRSIKLFQCGGWSTKKGLPDSPKVLLSLLYQVQNWQQQSGNHTVLAHCMNGAEKSGLFCVVSAVLERLKAEQDVAISQVIQDMRSVREQLIPNVEQYQFIHETVLAYLQQNETYSNFSI